MRTLVIIAALLAASGARAQDCKVSLAGPATGVAVTPFVILGGSTTMLAGGFASKRDAADKAMLGVGTIALTAGVAGLIWSSIRLRRKRQDKRDALRACQLRSGYMPGDRLYKGRWISTNTKGVLLNPWRNE